MSKLFDSGEVAKLFADAGLICVASLISPYRKDRDMCRAMMNDSNFIEACLSKKHLFQTNCFFAENCFACLIFDGGFPLYP